MRQSSPGKYWRFISRSGGAVLSLLAGVLLALGAASPNHFEQANRLYEQGKFEEAIALYTSMIKGGHNSPGLYFNLGNAYFKHGELGRAILNFRRAEKLAPRDPDIQANLRFARDRVSGSVSIQRGAWQRLFTFVKLNEIALVAALLFWTWAILFCISRLRPAVAPRLRTPSLVAASLLVSALLALALSYRIQNEKIAIVTGRQATVHLGPFAESQPAFTAADGAELRVLAEREDWIQVSDRSGRAGWLAATNAVVSESFSRKKRDFETNNSH